MVGEAVAVKRDVGGVRVVRINNCPGDIGEGHAARRDVRQRVRPGRGGQDSPVGQSDNPHIIILGRNADRAHLSTRGNGAWLTTVMFAPWFVDRYSRLVPK